MQSSTSPSKITAEIVARALDPDAKADSRGFMARCPSHADDKASLRVGDREGSQGVWFHCFAGCDAREVYRACQARGIKTGSDKASKTPVVVKTYAYNFYDGTFSTACVQRWGRPDGGNLPGHQPKTTWARFLKDTETGELYLAENSKPALSYDIAYMGDRLTTEATVFVVEGEKDCESLWNRYLAAIGIGVNFKWSDETAALLKGRRLVLVPDNDPPGQRAMERFGLTAARAGIEVCWLTLPDVGPKEDVTDWFEKYGGTGERLENLASALEPLDEDGLGWRGRLEYVRDGGLKQTYTNACVILENAPEFRGRLKYDDFIQEPLLDGEKPSEGGPGRLGLAIAGAYGLSYGSPKPIREAMVVVAEADRFDSLQDYVKGLPPWDGVERLGSWLRDYCGTTDAFSDVAGKRFLIGMISRAMEPGSKFDTALVLEGRQGTGKSTVCAILGGPYYSDTLPNLENKTRTSEEIQGKWLIEDAEMESASRAEVKRLKSFLSTKTDRFRGAYRTNAIDAPRRCVMVITTNRTDYLVDETGDRRFWPVRCGEIDLDGLAAVRDQLLAEAFALWVFGEPAYLVGTEVGMQRAEASERFELEASDLAGLLDWYLDNAPNGRRGQGTKRGNRLSILHMPTMIDDLRGAEKLPHGTPDRVFSLQFGRLLRHRGWVRKTARIGVTKANVFGYGDILPSEGHSNVTNLE